MQKFLQTLPIALINNFTEKHGDWQHFIQQKCPIATVALNYAETLGINAEFKKYAKNKTITSSGGHAEAQFFNRKILMGYRDSYDLSDTLPTMGHEIKHINQFEREPGVASWGYVINNLAYSLHFNEKAYPDKFTITPAIDRVLLGLIIEIDSATYGSIVMNEIIKSGASQHMHQDEAKCDDALKWTQIIQKEEHTFNFYTKLYKQDTDWIANAIKSCTKRGWKPPSFNLLPFPLSRVQNATFGFWEDANIKPPLAGKDGLKTINKLKRKIQNSPIFSEISEASEKWIKPQTASTNRKQPPPLIHHKG